MFKIFGKMKSDKRGFTLVELMIVLALMGLVGMLIGQLMGSIWKKYRLVEERYIVQSEVQAIMGAFQADASTGSLATATNVDLFYADPELVKTNKSFAACPELGTFRENDDGSLFFPSRAEDTTEKIYTYLFVYNDYFYVLNGGTDTAYRFKFSDEAKVNINYEVSVDAFEKDENNVEKETSTEPHNYLPRGVTITVKNAPDAGFNYVLHTSFSLKNTEDTNSELNMNNKTTYALTNSYVAGYTKGELPNFPNVTDTTGGKGVYVGESGSTYPYLQEAASIIKYISLYNYNFGSPTGSSGEMNVGTDCSISFLMAGNRIGEGVKSTLRSFRDGVLRDNSLGEMIIEKYYSWSPAIIEKTNESPALKKALTYAVEGTAYLIEMAK